MNDTDIRRLRANLHGELVQPGEDRYKEALGVWPGMIDKRAAPVVRRADGCDAVRAANLARDNTLWAAVRGAGHTAAGFGTGDNGIVIDMSSIKTIEVDPGSRIVRGDAGRNIRPV